DLPARVRGNDPGSGEQRPPPPVPDHRPRPAPPGGRDRRHEGSGRNRPPAPEASLTGAPGRRRGLRPPAAPRVGGRRRGEPAGPGDLVQLVPGYPTRVRSWVV